MYENDGCKNVGCVVEAFSRGPGLMTEPRVGLGMAIDVMAGEIGGVNIEPPID